MLRCSREVRHNGAGAPGLPGARTLLRHHLRKQYPRSGARYAGPQNPQLASTQPLLPAGEALSVASSTVRVKGYQRLEAAYWDAPGEQNNDPVHQLKGVPENDLEKQMGT